MALPSTTTFPLGLLTRAGMEGDPGGASLLGSQQMNEKKQTSASMSQCRLYRMECVDERGGWLKEGRGARGAWVREPGMRGSVGGCKATPRPTAVSRGIPCLSWPPRAARTRKRFVVDAAFASSARCGLTVLLAAALIVSGSKNIVASCFSRPMERTTLSSDLTVTVSSAFGSASSASISTS